MVVPGSRVACRVALCPFDSGEAVGNAGQCTGAWVVDATQDGHGEEHLVALQSLLVASLDAVEQSSPTTHADREGEAGSRAGKS